MASDILQTTMLAPMTARDIHDAIDSRYARPDGYGRYSEWLVFHELRIGTGYGRDAEQSIDAWVMHPLPSHNLTRIAFEIKVSRSDFLREIKQPRKRAFALMVSNEFYFVTPPGLVKASEIPPECGLMEVRRDGLHTVVKAPHRDSIMPTWRFVASLLRRAQADKAVS